MDDEEKTTSDSELIELFQKGDRNAFIELYSRYKKMVYSYLNSLNPEYADDLFQELWLKVIDKLPMYDERNQFRAWLFRIAHNMAMDRFRRVARHGYVFSVDEEDTPEIVQHGSEPWRNLDRSELSKAIGEAIQMLPIEQKEVFIWRQNGLSFREIAERQSCSLNTALARMQYALKNLRKQLETWVK